MRTGEVYTDNQISKLGNALIFLCENMGEPISKTHMLKLIYIIEEISIKKFGIPFFGLKFDLWKLDPVSTDLFVELSDEPSMLAAFLSRECKNNNFYMVPKKPFCDDEFSDLEIELLHEITNRFKYCTASELINYTHRRNTPWYNTAVKHDMLDVLESGKLNTTDIEIDLAGLLEGDEEKRSVYNEYKEFLSLSKSLKS